MMELEGGQGGDCPKKIGIGTAPPKIWTNGTLKFFAPSPLKPGSATG